MGNEQPSQAVLSPAELRVVIVEHLKEAAKMARKAEGPEGWQMVVDKVGTALRRVEEVVEWEVEEAEGEGGEQ